MENRKNFGMLDEADVQLVIKDNQTPAWTGACDELPPAELFDKSKKVLLVIHAGSNITAEEFNKTLEDISSRLPDDALFLYTVVDDELVNLKRMDLYINKD